MESLQMEDRNGSGMWEIKIISVSEKAETEFIIRNLSKLLNISQKKAEALISKIPFTLERTSDHELAEKYQRSLKKIGLEVTIQAEKIENKEAANYLNKKSKKSSIYVITGLTICVAMACGIIYKLVEYISVLPQPDPIVRYITEIDKIQNKPKFSCGSYAPDQIPWDVTDYSYNVAVDPKDKIYKYIQNRQLDKVSDIHVIGTGHGTSHIVVGESEKPIILLLMSAGYTRWFIDLEPNAKIEKVLVDSNASTVKLEWNRSSDLLFQLQHILIGNNKALDNIKIERIGRLPRCAQFYPGFQVGEKERMAILRSKYIELLLGQRETSLQVTYGKSKFASNTFYVPFEKIPVSEEKKALTYEAQKKRDKEQQSKLNDILKDTKVKDASRGFSRTSRQVRHQGSSAPELDYPKKRDPKTKAVLISDAGSLLHEIQKYQDQKLLPTHMPRSSYKTAADVLDWYEVQSFQNSRQLTFSGIVNEKLKCSNAIANRQRMPNALVVKGDKHDNTIKCSRGNQLYMMGDGNDVVDDAWDDDIIYGGPGNDYLDSGWGNDIFYFGYGWGEDTIEKTCHDSLFDRRNTHSSEKYYWAKDWHYSNFIVFGPKIKTSDIIKVKNKLIHKITGDSITLKNDCFNLVFMN
jgi:hypothetical protein